MNTKTFLIVDSGATKADWVVVRNGEIAIQTQSSGLSPIYQTESEIAKEVLRSIQPELNGITIDSVYFYGSGCIPEKTHIVENALRQSLGISHVEVYSDLIAASHALCGKERGIACILGTGSNSCEWDGERIVKQISPLGFILGDEGSGAALGKRLVSDALKNQLTAGLKEKLLEEYRLTPAEIIEKVYKQPFPSRFLASFAPFLWRNKDDESIRTILETSFSDFFVRNVMQYNFQANRVNFVGSIAYYFSDILKEVASNHGIFIGKIEKSPMNGLVEFYNSVI